MSTLNNQTKAAFMHREGSYSTRGSRNGANLLGWDNLEKESLSLHEKKQCLASRYKYLAEKIKTISKKDPMRKKVGVEMHEITLEIVELKKQMKFSHNNRGLSEYICDVLKEQVSRVVWHNATREARRRKEKDEEFLSNKEKEWRERND